MRNTAETAKGNADGMAAGLALAALLHTLRILLPQALPALGGFSPVGAAALFAGAALPRAGASLLTTLAGLLLGDLAILALVYHGDHGFPVYRGWQWVYASLALMTLMGRALNSRRFGWRKAGAVAVAATLTHWVLSNTGVWLTGGLEPGTGRPYPADLPGYARCLINAIPFQLRFLAGTLGFGAAAFALHRFALRHTASAARHPAAGTAQRP